MHSEKSSVVNRNEDRYSKQVIRVQSDVEIMRRIQAGETSLFALLVQRYKARLLRFAESKLQNHSDAEDLVQDAFLAAFHARQTYSPEFAFSTWIWTITLNLARNISRKRSRAELHRKEIATSGNPQQDQVTPLELLLKTEQLEQLDQWLSQIPEFQSDAIRLKFFGGLGFQEIALAMDCSVSGAKRRVKVGLQKLSLLSEND